MSPVFYIFPYVFFVCVSDFSRKFAFAFFFVLSLIFQYNVLFNRIFLFLSNFCFICLMIFRLMIFPCNCFFLIFPVYLFLFFLPRFALHAFLFFRFLFLNFPLHFCFCFSGSSCFQAFEDLENNQVAMTVYSMPPKVCDFILALFLCYNASQQLPLSISLRYIRLHTAVRTHPSTS